MKRLAKSQKKEVTMTSFFDLVCLVAPNDLASHSANSA